KYARHAIVVGISYVSGEFGSRQSGQKAQRRDQAAPAKGAHGSRVACRTDDRFASSVNVLQRAVATPRGAGAASIPAGRRNSSLLWELGRLPATRPGRCEDGP